MISDISAIFADENSACAFVESIVWPDGPVCPHCRGQNNKRLNGMSTRVGTYKCYDCRKPFTVKLGTILQDSHVPLKVWLQAIYLLQVAPKAAGPYQLHRITGLSRRAAVLLHRRLTAAFASSVCVKAFHHDTESTRQYSANHRDLVACASTDPSFSPPFGQHGELRQVASPCIDGSASDGASSRLAEPRC